MAFQMSLSKLQEKIWDGRLPLEIRLAAAECRTYDRSDPYLVGHPFVLADTRVPSSSIGA
jgi:autophagy-related protein 5